ncbi:5-formyltetrahydrofolate cyclo-ligase [Pullulanibacillus sp. KACC 23026]|uniref:5-formyltetrahydrofolate cyclo-ligase n=1 Tax=Pullulanibacillus sp. KACC 23026 TaxID=3028315 RepID=UPI0023AE81C9|nr:5-formyltetrahydrofolate cyclo-ligase [Pullulanibacillus sp. KACC 23026]WEG14271.1 5-formyltetrahydrofolate cyclo-ligase [Pullulanibacillus sp. KACC 23026]
MEKSRLRSQMKQLLSQMDLEQKKKDDQALHDALIACPFWQKSETIGLTLSTAHEIDTYSLIKRAWEGKKQVVVPKCDPSKKQLTFRQLTSFNQLESVYYGLMEPIVEKTEAVKHEDIDLIIVPGLWFDSRGYRIGHGGGYYDRYLSQYKGMTAALAYNEQVIDLVPNEDYDQPVQWLITPQSIRACQPNK